MSIRALKLNAVLVLLHHHHLHPRLRLRLLHLRGQLQYHRISRRRKRRRGGWPRDRDRAGTSTRCIGVFACVAGENGCLRSASRARSHVYGSELTPHLKWQQEPMTLQPLALKVNPPFLIFLISAALSHLQLHSPLVISKLQQLKQLQWRSASSPPTHPILHHHHHHSRRLQ